MALSSLALQEGPRIAADHCPFSLDLLIYRSIPPDSTVDFITIKGPYSYCATLGIKHGDVLGVIPDNDDHPENLLILRVGQSFFIRPRKQIEHIARRFSMHIVGKPDTARRKLIEVIGLVIVRLPADYWAHRLRGGAKGSQLI